MPRFDVWCWHVLFMWAILQLPRPGESTFQASGTIEQQQLSKEEVPGAVNEQQQQEQQQEKTTTTANMRKSEEEKPNIVIILIDDMGFNDVSFHGSNQILTPNIDALAYNGIILNRHYVPNLCSPSRATLLTGKYHIHTGMQHFVIINDEPWGLPLDQRLMPEIFREAGYSTNLVGKWHLGFWRKDLTPTMRGFDHHYGYYSGYIDYYNHQLFMTDRDYAPGLDLRNDLTPLPEANGTYATDLFTQEAQRIIAAHDTQRPLFLVMSHLAVHTGNENNPMQAPPEEVDKFLHITDVKRRTYAGMVSRLDDSVGQVVQALKEKNILNNTIILLYSDNGAPTVGIHSNAGSNYPFRGQKETPWEGALRSAGLIYSPLLKQRRYVSHQVTHSIDILPTLAAAANISLPSSLKLDGVNLWPLLNSRSDPQPRRLLHVLDDNFGYSSYMRGNLKYVNGSSFNGQYDNWLGDIAFNETDPVAPYYTQLVLSSRVQKALGDTPLTIEQIESMRAAVTPQCPRRAEDPNLPIYRCEPLVAPCYFDIERDPCERYNLANLHPLQVELLAQEVDQFRLSALPSARVAVNDARSDPALHGGNWEWWNETESVKVGGGAAESWPHATWPLVLSAINLFRI